MRCLVFLLILFSPISFAWTMTGHRVIAEIAWTELSYSTKTEVIELLEQHPDYADGILGRMPSDIPEHAQAKWLFREAAAWPDVVRDYRTSNPGKYAQFHRGPWHFINIATYTGIRGKREYESQITANQTLAAPSNFMTDMNVVQAIKKHMDQYNSGSSSDGEKALSLSWLLHLVGDLHQPLHSTTLYGLPPIEVSGDQGGNLICLTGQGWIENLHAFWDSQVYGGDSINDTEALARSLLQSRGERLQMQSEISDVDTWLTESVGLATLRAYPMDLLNASYGQINGERCYSSQAQQITLPAGYEEMARDISEDRAVLAAKRLAAFLN